MNRHDKEIAVNSLKKTFESTKGSFLVGIKGMTVEETLNLRKTLRTQGGSMLVVKNTLMKIAAKDVPGVQDLIPQFKEQVAIIFANNDVPTIAKILTQTAENNEHLKIVAGCFENRAVNKEQVKFVASLPTREVLLAQVCGALQAPISGFVSQLNMFIVRLLVVLKQIEEKQKQSV